MKKTMPALVVLWIAIVSFIQPIEAQSLPGGIVYSVPGMNQVEVRRNLVYKKDGPDEIKLDIYIPPNLKANERRPVVFFIYGSPLGARENAFIGSYVRLLAASGFVSVALDYRKAGDKAKDWEVAFSDIEGAIRFVRSNAAPNHIDPERVALWTFSGGGPYLSIGLRGSTPYIRCLVSYYGILDLSNAHVEVSEKSQVMEKFSPVAYLLKPNESLPSVLIARAGLERVPGLNAAADLFVSRMLALGGDVSLLVHPFGRHGFDGVDDDDQSRDIIAATLAFLKGRLNRPVAYEQKKAFIALMAAGNIDAAREFVRTRLNARGDKALTDALLSEDEFANIGYVLSGQKNTQAATMVFEWLVELHPDSITGRANLAYFYGMSGKTDKAIEEVKKAIALSETEKTLTEEQKKVGRQQMEDLLKMLQIPPAK
jgi:acetyl esterase/lipase